MKTQYSFSAAVVLLVGVACGVEVSVDGKACPCDTAGGYVCDTLKNICVHPDQVSVAPTPIPDAGPAAPVCDPCMCAADADCKDPTRPSCGPDKLCVQCVAGPDDKCTPGSYCNAKNQCTIGCRKDEDCVALVPGSPICQTDRHVCVQCRIDDTCGSGKKCTPSGMCTSTCTTKPDCASAGPGHDCCGMLCIDVTQDVLNCGGCNTVCTADNGTAKCEGNKCGADCADGFATCGPSGTCAIALRTDANNCGKCGTQCSKLMHVVNTSCSVGHCHFEKCEDGWLNTNGNADDGCEDPCGQKSNDVCCPGSVCLNDLSCNGGNRCK